MRHVGLNKNPCNVLDRLWGGLQKVRLPELQDNRHKKLVRLSALRTGRLQTPRNIPGRGQIKCDGIRAENRFRLSAKRTSPLK